MWRAGLLRRRHHACDGLRHDGHATGYDSSEVKRGGRFDRPRGGVLRRPRHEDEYADWWRDTSDWASRSATRAAGRVKDDDAEVEKLSGVAARLYALGDQPEMGRREDGYAHPLVVIVTFAVRPDRRDGGAEVEVES
ncbi:hypothetical protein KKC91_12735 [bacterium]|nr:hypothetical protein [bacterium]